MAATKMTAADKAAIKADPRWEGLMTAMGRTRGYLSEEVSPTIEDVLDAGRMSMFGGDVGKVSDEWFSELNKKFGWKEISKFLAKEGGY
jgi:hypothetical protein